MYCDGSLPCSQEPAMVPTLSQRNSLHILHRISLWPIFILSRDENNGFWIGWMDLLVFFQNYTHEITSSTLQLFSCLLNSQITLRLPLCQSYVTTDGQSASLCWNEAPIWGLRPDFYYCLTFAGLLMWGALSDERTGLSFARVTVSSNKSVVSMYSLHFTCY
jgi:hypothetical protein